MHGHGRWGVFALVGLVACGRATPVARGVDAWPLGSVSVELAPHAALEIETRNLSANARPVLHLWDPQLRREVASGAGSAWFSRAARLSFRNESAQVRRYELLVRAFDDDSRGRLDLDRSGRHWRQDVAVGGTRLALPLRAGLVYQTAAVPQGARAALLMLLDADGHLLALDDASGPTGLPRLAYVPNARAVVIASRDDERARDLEHASHAQAMSASPDNEGARDLEHASHAQAASAQNQPESLAERIGAAPQPRVENNHRAAFRVNVYANDPDDRDGDGLGRALERALHTCDAASDRACGHSLLTDYYRRVPNATRDSDRDGISDADELFGVSAPLLDLPRFGADPRHKDVFVEVDHDPRLPGLGFSEQDFVEIAALFAQGSPTSLRNPDQRAGVRLHFDTGFAPQDGANGELLGDFGGSGRAFAHDYRGARARDFSPRRQGYFRYGFSTSSGRGQASGDAFTVNRDLTRVTIFAHELGHTLGLAHYGHARWGRVNCKPNYFSIMNYLYQSHYEIGFSRRAGRALDPSAVFERGALRGVPAAVLREPPLELDVRGRDVDWNRDGVISDVAVRADLLWATYKSCDAAEHDSLDLASGDLLATTPVLLRTQGRLLALWIASGGRLAWRASEYSVWTPQRFVEGLVDLRHIAGLGLPDGDVALVGVKVDGSIRLTRLRMEASDELRVVSDRAISGVRTDHEPSLARLNVDEHFYGAPQLLAVLIREAAADGGVVQCSALGPESDLTCRPLLDDAGRPIAGASSPSLLTLPNGQTYGVFADGEGWLRVFVYEANRDRWRDVSQTAFASALGPRGYGRTGLAFHRYRAADGVELGRGALYVSFSEPESSAARYPDNPHLFISESLALRPGASEPLSLRWRGALSTEWTTLAAGSGVSLFEDDEAEQLSGLMLLQDDRAHTLKLHFMPFVDGEFQGRLGSGDDFEVMERGICTGIRSEAQCGDATTGAY